MLPYKSPFKKRSQMMCWKNICARFIKTVSKYLFGSYTSEKTVLLSTSVFYNCHCTPTLFYPDFSLIYPNLKIALSTVFANNSVHAYIHALFIFICSPIFLGSHQIRKWGLWPEFSFAGTTPAIPWVSDIYVSICILFHLK